MGSSLNFRNIYKIPYLLILYLIGCIPQSPGWEELESEYEHVLNVFGIINLDSDQTSFIGLYRTTDLDETSQTFVGIDTLYWCDCDDDDCWDCNDDQDGYWEIDSIYEPAALIKDASVVISDEMGNNFEFSFVERLPRIDTLHFDTTFNFYGVNITWDTTIFDTNHIRLNFYTDTTGTFVPQPFTNYSLSIIAPGFDVVSGSLRTPDHPHLDSLSQKGRSVDTIIVNDPFDIHWQLLQDGNGIISQEVIFGDWLNDSNSIVNRSNWCGGYFDPFVVGLSDESLNPVNINPWFCDFNENKSGPYDYFVRLTSMDQNYYDYFIIGETGEYSNALLNYPTTKGFSSGIVGGFGLFGSIASDGIVVKIAHR